MLLDSGALLELCPPSLQQLRHRGVRIHMLWDAASGLARFVEGHMVHGGPKSIET